MSNNGPSVFTFELNESLWFKKGQEVEELMGVSLEPEISIQDFDEYVSIRGVIELNGEYFQVKEEAEEEQVLSLRDYPSKRLMERVEHYENGVNEFFHRFPVEISVPKYRVNVLDEVMVGIESFDYELPEKSQLKLNATVAIHGVKEENVQRDMGEEKVKEEEEELERAEPPFDTPVDESFHFDVKEKEKVEKEGSEITNSAETNSSEEKTSEEKDRWKYKKTQSLSEFFNNTKVPDEDDAHDQEQGKDNEDNEYEDHDLATVTNISEYEDNESPDLESPRTDQDTKYLLNIFEGKEEGFASMKMRIVQEQDTLESIAETYELSPLHISKTNRLDDDLLAEGQILYIPTKEKKNS